MAVPASSLWAVPAGHGGLLEWASRGEVLMALCVFLSPLFPQSQDRLTRLLDFFQHSPSAASRSQSLGLQRGTSSAPAGSRFASSEAPGRSIPTQQSRAASLFQPASTAGLDDVPASRGSSGASSAREDGAADSCLRSVTGTATSPEDEKQRQTDLTVSMLEASPQEVCSSLCSSGIPGSSVTSPCGSTFTSPLVSFSSSPRASRLQSEGDSPEEHPEDCSLPSLLQQGPGPSLAPGKDKEVRGFQATPSELAAVLSCRGKERTQKGERDCERAPEGSARELVLSSTSLGGSTRAAVSQSGSVGSSLENLSESVTSLDATKGERRLTHTLRFKGSEAERGFEIDSADEGLEGGADAADEEEVPRPRVRRSLAFSATEIREDTSDEDGDTPACARIAEFRRLGGSTTGSGKSDEEEEEGPAGGDFALPNRDSERLEPSRFASDSRDERIEVETRNTSSSQGRSFLSSSPASDFQGKSPASVRRSRRRIEQTQRRPHRLRRARSCPCLEFRRASRGLNFCSPFSDQLRRHSVEIILLPAAWNRRAARPSWFCREFPTAFSDAFALHTADAFSLNTADRFSPLNNSGPSHLVPPFSPPTTSSPEPAFGEKEDRDQTATHESVDSLGSPRDLPVSGVNPLASSSRSADRTRRSRLEEFALALRLQMKENALRLQLVQRQQRALVESQEAARRRQQTNLQRLKAHQNACASSHRLFEKCSSSRVPVAPHCSPSDTNIGRLPAFSGVAAPPCQPLPGAAEGEGRSHVCDIWGSASAVMEHVLPSPTCEAFRHSTGHTTGARDVERRATTQRQEAVHSSPGRGGMLLLSLNLIGGIETSRSGETSDRRHCPLTTVSSSGSPDQVNPPGLASSRFERAGTDPFVSTYSFAERLPHTQGRERSSGVLQSVASSTASTTAPSPVASGACYPLPSPPSPGMTTASAARGRASCASRGVLAAGEDAAQFQFPVAAPADLGLALHPLSNSASATVTSLPQWRDALINGEEGETQEGGFTFRATSGAMGMAIRPLSSISAASGTSTETAAFEIQPMGTQWSPSTGSAGVPFRSWLPTSAFDLSAPSASSMFVVAHRPTSPQEEGEGSREGDGTGQSSLETRDRSASPPRAAPIHVRNYLYRAAGVGGRHAWPREDAGRGEGIPAGPLGETLDGGSREVSLPSHEAVSTARGHRCPQLPGQRRTEFGPSAPAGGSEHVRGDARGLPGSPSHGRAAPAMSRRTSGEARAPTDLQAADPATWGRCMQMRLGGDEQSSFASCSQPLVHGRFEHHVLLQQRQQEFLQRQLLKSEEQIQGLRALMDRLLVVMEHLRSRDGVSN
ncbi:conserved hypothetical protein [Neospora caninum Liverpool]|uniref:Uncharacterized protein n=1 Tax=Neospora caninum (strain Liverpool) TaxID=572307 RepID=F0VNT4_NEOCL|nr:conserved hypothetical protein [Neospora caninum Liverpool]CBZ55380.1 conserved hypothetical protein [Neospora caninum Liverpool]|eukprot:XP_003885408.1 conserved hypothetical protein [Neospora caninum Liverpool]